MKRFLPIAATAIALFGAYAAQAASGFVTRNADLYAGPGEYPKVVSVPQSAPVQVYGCIDAYAWCDVMWKDQRGWVRGELLAVEHRGRRVVMRPGVTIDVPVIVFDGNTYWEEHYRERPFYRERDRYLHR